MSETLESHWAELAGVALLGSDRRPVPEPPGGPLAELAAARHAGDAGEALLDRVAVLGALRKGGLRPGPGVPLLVPAAGDLRPICPPAATTRLVDLLAAWPQLVDEWLATVVAQGWRLSPELVVPLLAKFRSDGARRALVREAAGPLADWLVELFPHLVAPRKATVKPEPPALPADIARLAELEGEALAFTLADGLERGELVNRHRPLLERLLCLVPVAHLPACAALLNRAGTNPNTMGLALSLADLATTRHAMIQELLR